MSPPPSQELVGRGYKGCVVMGGKARGVGWGWPSSHGGGGGGGSSWGGGRQCGAGARGGSVGCIRKGIRPPWAQVVKAGVEGKLGR